MYVHIYVQNYTEINTHKIIERKWERKPTQIPYKVRSESKWQVLTYNLETKTINDKFHAISLNNSFLFVLRKHVFKEIMQLRNDVTISDTYVKYILNIYENIFE